MTTGGRTVLSYRPLTNRSTKISNNDGSHQSYTTCVGIATNVRFSCEPIPIMSFAQWQRPVVAVASGICIGIGRIAFNAPQIALAIRSATTPISIDITGRRAASVKAQGQYKLKPKRTIPRKLGAKRATGESARADGPST